ncbi:MAG: NUDIX hydrolase [Chloroflexi bacterium]|nr:NUDIX hydrolase [Chloroflexota bacterium]
MVLLREGPAGIEVFMVRRHREMRFAADMFVFPGGTIRDDDEPTAAEVDALHLDPIALRSALAAQGDPLAERPDGGLSLWIAGLRELFEEAGVLLASSADGSPLDLAEPARAARFGELRGALQRGDLSLADLAQREGLLPRADLMFYVARWITPRTSPRRYDTRFFLAEMPAEQTALHCQIENTEGVWTAPRDALREAAAGRFDLLFVTAEQLRRVAVFQRLEDVFAEARCLPPRPAPGAIHDGLPVPVAEWQEGVS